MKAELFPIRNTTRREFLGVAAGLAAALSLPRYVLGAAKSKPSSVFKGVRIGTITYSYRGAAETAEDTLKAVLEDDLSEIELLGSVIQQFAGIPGVAKEKAAGEATAEQRQAQLGRCRELRRMYNQAGVNIHLHKLDFGPSDEDIEFNFQVAKALGCTGITLERNEAMAKKLAPFADKHKIWIGFHNHTTNYPVMDHYDPILEFGKYIGFNFDIGHYVAGTKGLSPIPVIEKYHDRIVSLHVKDRTPEGGNLPFGQGKTPIKEVLQLMKKEKWTFPADIELEYKVPQGSNPVAEVAKCVQYCKECLA